MRREHIFNDGWLFAPAKLDLNAPDADFEPVTLPHSNALFSHHNIDNTTYQFISTYRKRFEYTRGDEESLVYLEFDGVMLACTVYLNGILLGEYAGGYRPFTVNITPGMENGENLLSLYVDSRERKDIPPYGHLVDYLTFGGIYRDVSLKIVPPVHLENIFAIPANVLTEPQLGCRVRLNQVAPGLSLEATLLDRDGNRVAMSQGEVESPRTTLYFPSLPAVQLWDLENPALYTVCVSLQAGGQTLDTMSARFGFREAEFRPDGGFYLNNERIQLFGLNRHQTYPYIGAAAPGRLQRQDAEILKYELACNIVRTSHYPQSPHFLNRCDELGLLVFEEITGWQHIGDENWQALVVDELEAMIERDHNHPAIILWGVRVNESPDHDELYSHTNRLARELDPTRQTGGVRCILGSSFLEDVYTYNDFSNTVREPTETPYLITEFGGHMFPTKIWDHEERLIEHALLHARIHNRQMGHSNIAGAIGWCAFDYATHIEFGSGNRICYHGVMDTFRLPKWAAYFYQSQQSPEKGVVLKAATHWTMGDRSGGGYNPLTVFSNCDEVEVRIGTIQAGKYRPDFAAYPHLKHPPFIIEGLNKYNAWGQRKFYDLHLIGTIQGEPVAEQWISSSRLPEKLELTADTRHLVADGADMTRLVFRITDEYGNPLPYAVQIVEFELEGEAELIGENPFPLIGGQAALYLKAGHQAGTVTVHARTKALPGASISVEMVPKDTFL